MITPKQLDLRGLTEAERDANVNIEISQLSGWTDCETISSRTGVRVTGGCPPDGKGGFPWLALPSYATSADAVLPLLEIHPVWVANRQVDSKNKSVQIITECKSHVCAEAPTFPLAACYALLRANGIEVLT